MYNRGSDPETLFESLAMVADVIRKQHCNHSQRETMMEGLQRMLVPHQAYGWSEFLQQLYVLDQILFATAYSEMTHGQVKDMLRLFATTARQFRTDILDEKKRKYEETNRAFTRSLAESLVAETTETPVNIHDDEIPF